MNRTDNVPRGWTCGPEGADGWRLSRGRRLALVRWLAPLRHGPELRGGNNAPAAERPITPKDSIDRSIDDTCACLIGRARSIGHPSLYHLRGCMLLASTAGVKSKSNETAAWLDRYGRSLCCPSLSRARTHAHGHACTYVRLIPQTPSTWRSGLDGTATVQPLSPIHHQYAWTTNFFSIIILTCSGWFWNSKAPSGSQFSQRNSGAMTFLCFADMS
jgi:hypothetical protein